jgi:thiol:disulfide interchange protein
MVWIRLNCRLYFTLRSLLQLVAFCLLAVTLILISQFSCDYWQITLYLLVGIHVCDMMSFSSELISYFKNKSGLAACRIVLDIISFCLSLVVQAYFGASFTDTIQLKFLVQDYSLATEDQKMRNDTFKQIRAWTGLEITLSYILVIL